MKSYKKQPLKAKVTTKNTHNVVAQEDKKKRRKKRKSVLFKPEKCAKIAKRRESSSKDDTSEISFSLDEEKTIISDGRSDFDNDFSNGMSDTEYMDTSIDTNISSSILDDFFKNDSDNSNSNDNYDADESFEVKHESTLEDNNEDSYDSMNSTLNELIEKSQNEESDSDGPESSFEMHEFGTDYIVVLKYSHTIRMLGYCDLKVLHGKINILGYSLDNSSKKQTIYSPKGSSLLTVRNTSNYCNETRKMRNLIPKLAKHPLLKESEVRKDSSVLLVSKKQDATMNFIQKHISQWIVPKETLSPCININPKGPWNAVVIPEEWNEVVQNAIGQSKILVCGGKGVGKSTFLRYAVNCLLQKYESVRVVDLDPGQSEFSVPSTLSVVKVVEPLLGVNYTHLKNAERYLFFIYNFFNKTFNRKQFLFRVFVISYNL